LPRPRQTEKPRKAHAPRGNHNNGTAAQLALATAPCRKSVTARAAARCART
jgi:hypothetical protein